MEEVLGADLEFKGMAEGISPGMSNRITTVGMDAILEGGGIKEMIIANLYGLM